MQKPTDQIFLLTTGKFCLISIATSASLSSSTVLTLSSALTWVINAHILSLDELLTHAQAKLKKNVKNHMFYIYCAYQSDYHVCAK